MSNMLETCKDWIEKGTLISVKNLVSSSSSVIRVSFIFNLSFDAWFYLCAHLWISVGVECRLTVGGASREPLSHPRHGSAMKGHRAKCSISATDNKHLSTSLKTKIQRQILLKIQQQMQSHEGLNVPFPPPLTQTTLYLEVHTKRLIHNNKWSATKWARATDLSLHLCHHS